MPPPAIQTADLTRTYKVRRHRRPAPGDTPTPAELTALAGVSLEVGTGELFGLLGPNGAGKTTLIKILTTLLTPTTGRAFVEGFDVVTQSEEVRRRINMVSGGESSGYGLLTIRENLWLFSQLYGIAGAVARQRIVRMLNVTGLTDRADTKISQLSTGLRQKMNFCRGFVTDPRVLFLDEPTLGLDVTAARAIRAFLRQWLAEQPGRTLLLTTHYMTEADELCDRLAIIDKGRVLALDTPAALKRVVQKHTVFEITLSAEPSAEARAALERLAGVHRCVVTPGADSAVLHLHLDEESAIGAVVPALVRDGGHILTLQKIEPTLEDVFIQLVGHGLGDDEAAR
jgi:ABC-2 type transport system ATP-binding protein